MGLAREKQSKHASRHALTPHQHSENKANLTSRTHEKSFVQCGVQSLHCHLKPPLISATLMISGPALCRAATRDPAARGLGPDTTLFLIRRGLLSFCQSCQCGSDRGGVRHQTAMAGRRVCTPLGLHPVWPSKGILDSLVWIHFSSPRRSMILCCVSRTIDHRADLLFVSADVVQARPWRRPRLVSACSNADTGRPAAAPSSPCTGGASPYPAAATAGSTILSKRKVRSSPVLSRVYTRVGMVSTRVRQLTRTHPAQRRSTRDT